jgi:hypothetical protein
MTDLASRLMECSGAYDNGYSIFNIALEYFQGKSKELRECEKYCTNIVTKIGNIMGDVDILKTPISGDDVDNIMLEKTLAKFFKVRKVRLYWDNGSVINAYTYPNGCITRANAKKNLLDGKGSNMNISIFLYTNAVSAAQVTGSELLAIILHEIGHNFHFCPLSTFSDIVLGILSFGLRPLMRLIDKGLTIVTAELVDLVRKYVPIVSNLFDVYHRFWLEVNYLMNPVNIVRTMVTCLSNPVKVMTSVMQNIDILGYGEEKIADSFAARYGYGSELVSALKKFNVPRDTMYGKLVMSGKVGGIVADIAELQVTIINGLLLDPHPNTDQRAASMVKKLKRDLAKGDYPRELRSELEAEIKRLEEAHRTVNIINESVDGPNIRKAIFDVVNKATGNRSDLREIFNFYFDSYQF